MFNDVSCFDYDQYCYMRKVINEKTTKDGKPNAGRDRGTGRDSWLCEYMDRDGAKYTETESDRQRQIQGQSVSQ